MKSCDILELQKSCFRDPCFFVDVYNLGRGFTRDNQSQEPHIVSSIDICVWKILEDKLIPTDNVGVFYNSETYLIKWSFEYVLNDGDLKLETIFFYWKGSNAPKGLSPLPENFDDDSTIVHRIVQWSEPPIFFHIFPKPVVVFNNKYDYFIPKTPKLFMVYGESQNEVHLFELKYFKKNLRSRGMFFIVVPIREVIYIWYGSKIDKELETVVTESKCRDALKDSLVFCKDFRFLEIRENEEVDLFEGDSGKYFNVKEECNFSPRLFYLNSITGNFLATEIEYPLRNKNCKAAFPFLQSHLTVADESGLFLLDNNYEIWLVWNEMEKNRELYNLATEIANKYAKLKENSIKRSVPVRFVNANIDLIEFTNIFPFWN